MSEEEGPIVMNATVDETLPNARYKVTLEDSRRSRATVHVSGRSSLLRILPGDRVVVELTPYDISRGRIVRKQQ